MSLLSDTDSVFSLLLLKNTLSTLCFVYVGYAWILWLSAKASSQFSCFAIVFIRFFKWLLILNDLKGTFIAAVVWCTYNFCLIFMTSFHSWFWYNLWIPAYTFYIILYSY